MPQQPNEEMNTQDALSNSSGTSANDPRPTSVNDNRTQPESPANEDELPIDAGATRTAAFDEGAQPRDEQRSSQQNEGASRH